MALWGEVARLRDLLELLMIGNWWRQREFFQSCKGEQFITRRIE